MGGVMHHPFRCPGCGCANPDIPHLMREYLDLSRAGWGMFGPNADRARGHVADILIGQGITEIPNIFGPIPIHKRPTPRPTGEDYARAGRLR